VNRSYEVGVEIDFPAKAEAGLLLYCRDGVFGGAAVKQRRAFTYWRSKVHTSAKWAKNHIVLKLRNLNHDVALYYGDDSGNLKKFDKGIEVSRSFGTLRIALYAAGQGEVVFRNFKYHGLD